MFPIHPTDSSTVTLIFDKGVFMHACATLFVMIDGLVLKVNFRTTSLHIAALSYPQLHHLLQAFV